MPASRNRARHRHNPALESFGSGKNWGLILFALFGATAPEGVVWYTGQFYALFYMTTVLKINYVTVYIIMMIALTAAAPFFIVFGALSDRIGRRNIMTLGFALAVVTYWPVFTWLGTFKDNPVILTILVFYMVILVTMVYGPIAAFLVELFPARIRYTSMSLPYHVGNGVFGGLVPAAGASIAAYYRHRAERAASIRWRSPRSGSSSASPSCASRRTTSRSGTRSAAKPATTDPQSAIAAHGPGNAGAVAFSGGAERARGLADDGEEFAPRGGVVAERAEHAAGHHA